MWKVRGAPRGVTSTFFKQFNKFQAFIGQILTSKRATSLGLYPNGDQPGDYFIDCDVSLLSFSALSLNELGGNWCLSVVQQTSKVGQVSSRNTDGQLEERVGLKCTSVPIRRQEKHLKMCLAALGPNPNL